MGEIFSQKDAYYVLCEKYSDEILGPNKLKDELWKYMRLYRKQIPAFYYVSNLVDYGVSNGYLIEKPGGKYKVEKL